VVQQLDPAKSADFASTERCFDTAICLNVIEYLDEPAALLRSLRAALKPNGSLIVLAPQGAALFGNVDRRLGHKRRYRAAELRALLEAENFTVEQLYQFNRVGTLPWLTFSRVMGAGNINKLVLKVFDKTVWLWRRIDGLFPWPGLSLIVVARNGAAATGPVPARRDAIPQGLSRE